MKHIVVQLSLLLVYFIAASQPLQKQWDYSYGGFDSDFINQLLATSDGGFLVGGISLSDSSFDKSENNFNTGTNTYDIWILKCDANGIKMWDRNLGGTQNDFFYSMINTSDGGVLVMGSTNSPMSGNISNPPIGTFDMYLVKLSPTGTIEWDQRFGGDAGCSASDALEIPGGGYVIGGSTNCQQGFDVTQAPYGSYDYWLVRIDASGNKLWDKRYGGTSDDSGLKILSKPGGYLLVSASVSNTGGVKSQNNYVNGKSDIWCIATDTSGNILWDKLLGSLEDDYSIDAKFTPDQNYIFSCLTYANAGADKSENTYGVDDFWVIKTDTALNKLWDHSVGGDSNEDDGGNLTVTNTGNYLVTGTSYSSAGFWKTATNNGPENTWSVMLDVAGNKVWDKTVLTGYSHTEAGYAIQLNDGCFVMANDGDGFTGNDKTEVSNSFDYWCVKYCDTTLVPSSACNFIVNAGPDTVLCGTTAFQLTGSTNLPPSLISSVLWQPGTGLSDSTILNPIVNAATSQTYTLLVESSQGSELIFNGDFSLGDTGFYGAYIPGQGGISGIVSNPGDYDVNTSPHNSHIDFADFGDHTTGSGNMLIVNGSVNFNDTLWCQNVLVAPNNNYNFSAWATTANWQNPAILRFTINSIALGPDLYLAADTGVWHQFTATWNSGIAVNANVCLMDMSTWSAGNDFAVDDISLTGLCVISDSVTITIGNTASISLGADASLCAGDTILLHAGAGYSTYSWQLNNTLLSTQDSILYAIQTGTYIIIVTSTNGCTATDTLVISSGTTSITLPSDTLICAGDDILINAAAGFLQYQWSYNSTPLPFSGNFISVSLAGTYVLNVQDSAGCSATDSIIIMNEQNFLNLGSDISFCDGDSDIVAAIYNGPLNLQWYYNGTVTGIIEDSIVVTQEGTYTVTGTSAIGCIVSDSLTVMINNLPDVKTLSDTVICNGNQLVLLATGATSYQWSPVIFLDNPVSAAPVTSPLYPITYIVTGTSQEGCVSSDTVNIDVSPAPTSVFTFTSEVSCEGVKLETDNKSTGASGYLWNFGDGTFSSEEDPGHVYPEIDDYVVQLIAYNGNCADTSTVNTGMSNDSESIANENIFTPNNDGKNDCFDGGVPEKLSNCYSLTIFTRWGQKIFTSSSSQLCWNGYSNSDGEPSPEGVYFYVVSILSKTYNGTIYLKR